MHRLGLAPVVVIMALGAGIGWSCCMQARQQPLLVICSEEDRSIPQSVNPDFGGRYQAPYVTVDQNGKRVFTSLVHDFFFAHPSFTWTSPSPTRSVKDYFLKNSFGQLDLVEAAVLGPYLRTMTTDQIFAEQAFRKIHIEALDMADKDFNFAPYDKNHDGTVTGDELTIVLLSHQATVGGGVQKLNLGTIKTNDGVNLDMNETMCCSFPSFDTNDVHALGLCCHEIAHSPPTKAIDVYNKDYAPIDFSLMDSHQFLPLLDPFTRTEIAHWCLPRYITQDQWVDVEAKSTAASQPLRVDSIGEHFLIENRQRGTYYDSFIPDTGIAIYHILGQSVQIERAGADQNNVAMFLWGDPGDPVWGRDFYFDSSPNSRLRGGTTSGCGVWGIPPSAQVMRVYVDTLGPGILVQARLKTVRLTTPRLGIGGSSSSSNYAEFEIRLVDTSPSAYSGWFDLRIMPPTEGSLQHSLDNAKIQWSQNPVRLFPYVPVLVTLRVEPAFEYLGSAPLKFEIVASGCTEGGFAVDVPHP